MSPPAAVLTASPGSARPLVHRVVDPWLLGGAGLVAWLVLTAVVGRSAAPLGAGLTWAFAVLTAMHFGASYHLAYAGGRRALRAHPVALVIVPAVLLAASGATVVVANGLSPGAARPLVRVLLVTVFTLTGWHYIKQAFGVAMLALRSQRVAVGRREVAALRYGLYPVWLYQVMNVYGHGAGSSYRGTDLAVGVVPTAAVALLRVAAVAGAVVAGAVIIGLARRSRSRPPAALWTTYLAAVLWFVFPPSYVSMGLVLSGLHGLQYLAVAHRAEVDRAVEAGEDRLVHWWLCVFGGAAAGGLLLSRFLPNLLDGSRLDATLPGLLGSLLFVVMNLHHYAIDATIWRRGGEHLRRITAGPAGRDTAVPIEVAGAPSLV